MITTTKIITVNITANTITTAKLLIQICIKYLIINKRFRRFYSITIKCIKYIIEFIIIIENKYNLQ